MLTHVIIFALSFIGIWIGSGIVIKSVEKLSRTLSIPSFTLSFLVLGFFTSIGELSVGINSVIKDDPEIYVGNLIGASIVLFMLVIPLLAILGNSIRISPEFRGINLPISLLVVALPVLMAMDGKIGTVDSLIILSAFVLMLIGIGRQKNLTDKLKMIDTNSKDKFWKSITSIIFGIAIIFICSSFIVDQTVYFSDLLNVSPFLISLLVISIGTNIPELSLVIRSAFMKNNQVAFGDYIGSSVFNTFLVGFLTMIYGKTVYLTNSYLVSLLFLIVGLIMFYFFAKSKNTISRLEGLILLTLYGLFLFTELSLHKGLLLW